MTLLISAYIISGLNMKLPLNSIATLCTFSYNAFVIGTIKMK